MSENHQRFDAANYLDDLDDVVGYLQIALEESGDDPTAVELILMGGKGNISVTANVAPREMADLCEAALEGNAEKARAINEKLMPLHKDLFCEANPIPVKWALVEMGLMQKGIRLPLTWLSEGCHEKVRTALRQSGVLV